MYGEGPAPAEWMIVGEAPGYHEAQSGQPFVGASGRRLDLLIHEAGLTRSDMYITNLVKHRPPQNRTPKAAEIKACSPFLASQVALIQPRVILACGTKAARFFIGPRLSMTRDHGQPVEVVWDRANWAGKVVPLYHPAYTFQQVKAWPVLVEAWAALRGRLAREPDSPTYTLSTEAEVTQRINTDA